MNTIYTKIKRRNGTNKTNRGNKGRKKAIKTPNKYN